MPTTPKIWDRMRKATWTPFLALLALLPLVDTQTADHRRMLMQAALLLLPAGLLFSTTQIMRNLIKEAESEFKALESSV